CSNQPGSYDCSCPGQYGVYGEYCGCRPQSSGNVIKDGNMDAGLIASGSGSNKDGWQKAGSTENSQRLDSLDADDCGDSTSLYVEYAGGDMGMVTQCVTVTPSTTYHFGFKYRRGRYIGVGCEFYLYAQSNCSGDVKLAPSISSG